MKSFQQALIENFQARFDLQFSNAIMIVIEKSIRIDRTLIEYSPCGYDAAPGIFSQILFINKRDWTSGRFPHGIYPGSCWSTGKQPVDRSLFRPRCDLLHPSVFP